MLGGTLRHCGASSISHAPAAAPAGPPAPLDSTSEAGARVYEGRELKACARCERAGRICVLCTSNGTAHSLQVATDAGAPGWHQVAAWRPFSAGQPPPPPHSRIHTQRACMHLPDGHGRLQVFPTWSPPLADRRLSTATRSPAPPAACPAQVRTLTELQVARHSTWLRTAPTNLLNYPTRGRTGPAANCPFPERQLAAHHLQMDANGCAGALSCSSTA